MGIELTYAADNSSELITFNQSFWQNYKLQDQIDENNISNVEFRSKYELNEINAMEKMADYAISRDIGLKIKDERGSFNTKESIMMEADTATFEFLRNNFDDILKVNEVKDKITKIKSAQRVSNTMTDSGQVAKVEEKRAVQVPHKGASCDITFLEAQKVLCSIRIS